MSAALIQLRGVRKEYRTSSETVVALRDIDLDIEPGEFVAVVGPSGGGKTTLLSMLGLLDTPTAGSYSLGPVDTDSLSDRELTALRSRQFGFIFQSFHLLGRRPVRDSVELGMLYQGLSRTSRRELGGAALARVGLAGKSDVVANALSGGQQQRVAIARAIAGGADVILADEPTGNLDSLNGRKVLDQLADAHRAGATVIVVTHSDDVAARATRVIRIEDGQIVSDRRRYHATPAKPPAAAGFHHLRAWDVCSDAIRSLASRARSTVGLVLAVGVAVAFMVLTMGLSGSARAQVSAAFDATANREVSAAWPGGAGLDGADLRNAVTRLGALAGVDAAVGLVDHGKVEVSVERGAAPGPALEATLHAVTGRLGAATDTEVVWGSSAARSLPLGTALMGRSLAQQLQLAPLAASPSVIVNGRPLGIVGLIESSGRYPLLAGEVVVSLETAESLASPGQASIAIRTANGAATQVGRQAAVAIDPFAPESLVIDVPMDPAKLRHQVESGIQIALAGFTALATVVAVVTLANAMSMSVVARTGEFGLRRAVGARGRHLAFLVTAEAAMVGAAGGLAGLVAGLLSLLGFTIAQGWQPTFDVRLAPLAVCAGALLAIASSVVGALRAARLQPAVALRT